MNRRWMSRLYRDEVGEKVEAGEEAGFQTANADTLADLYLDNDGDEAPTPSEPASAVPPAAPPAEPVAPVPPVTAAPLAPPPQPVAPAVQPSAPVEPAQPVAAQPAAAPVAPQEPVQPAAPMEPVETEAQRQERLTAERVKLAGELERMYAIPEAEVSGFRDEPEKYIPKLAAKLHVEVLTAVANGIYAQLPNLMNGILAAQKQQTTYEDKFFQRWQKLDTKELRPKVLEMVQRYRQANPTVSFDTLTEDVGAMAHVRFRIPYEEGAPTQPVVPVQPVAAPTRPFVPGGTGGASPPVAPANPNQFTQLANEFLSDPDGW